MEGKVKANYKQQNEMFLSLFDGRWTILMCGVCGYEGHEGVAPLWGELNKCEYSKFAVSSNTFPNGTHKFLPTHVFLANVSSAQGGATFPSMFCNEESPGSAEGVNYEVNSTG